MMMMMKVAMITDKKLLIAKQYRRKMLVGVVFFMQWITNSQKKMSLAGIRTETFVNDRLQCSTQQSKSSQLGFIRATERNYECLSCVRQFTTNDYYKYSYSDKRG